MDQAKRYWDGSFQGAQNFRNLISIDSLSSNILTTVFADLFYNSDMFDWKRLDLPFPNSAFPITPTKKSVTAKLPNRSFSLTIKQIALSISNAATVYKLQGDILSTFFVPEPRGRGETKTSLYKFYPVSDQVQVYFF